MVKKTVCFVTLICFLMTVTSCATIVAGRTQNLPVTSIPSGAIVTVGTQKQMSPATFILDKGQEYVVRVEKEGYQPTEIVLKKGVTGWVWGNIIFGLIGGAIGLAIDISSGSASKFVPSSIEVNLVKQQLSSLNLKDKTILFVKLVENNQYSGK